MHVNKHDAIIHLTTIPDDEPVFVLRAEDEISPLVMREWAYYLMRAYARQGKPIPRGVHEARELAVKMEKWQMDNKMKLPE